jgi:hypothetical protein
MKRVKVLFGQRRLQVLVAMAALLLAVSVVIGSGASFTSSTANAGNLFTGGILSHTNSKAPGAILTLSKMRPGDSVSGTVTLSNTGDVPGKFTLSKSMVTDADGLGAELNLVITEGATTVYTGTLAGVLTNKDLSTWKPAPDPSQTHTYTFTVTWPNTGVAGDDNVFMGKSATYRFDWTGLADSTVN